MISPKYFDPSESVSSQSCIPKKNRPLLCSFEGNIILDGCILVLPMPVKDVNDKKETNLFYFREQCFMPEMSEKNCTKLTYVSLSGSAISTGVITASALLEGAHCYTHKNDLMRLLKSDLCSCSNM